MHLTIIAIGSRGDLYPYTALGKGLAEAGHQVRMASHRPYKPFIREHGLEFMPIEGNPQAMLQTEDAIRWLESGRNPLQFIRQIMRLSHGLFERALEDCWEACQGADAVIFSTLGWAGYHAAERLGIPAFSAPLQPVSPTQEFPTMFVPAGIRLGPGLNRFSHQVSEQLMWQPFRRQVNRWRRERLGLKPAPFLGPFAEIQHGTMPTLYAYSPSVVPRPADWPASLHVTGYWFLDPAEPWQPGEKLQAFLDGGSRPVSVGFGSMTNRNPTELFRIVVEALERSGERGLILSGWGGLKPEEMPDHIYLIDYVPHAWLFPRVKAVIHHGGAGTTAAGLRAGVPSILIPFFGDQPFWAQRIEALGAGPPAIPRKRLTAENLAAAIRNAADDPGVRSRADLLGRQIRAENGVANAISLIEHYMHD